VTGFPVASSQMRLSFTQLEGLKIRIGQA